MTDEEFDVAWSRFWWALVKAWRIEWMLRKLTQVILWCEKRLGVRIAEVSGYSGGGDATMTDEEIHAILTRMIEGDMNWHSAADRGHLRFSERTALGEVLARLAEVERLRDYNQRMDENNLTLHRQVAQLSHENAALRGIAQALADADDGPVVQDREYLYWDCGFCGGTSHPSYEQRDVQHTPDCPVTKARALLANEEMR